MGLSCQNPRNPMGIGLPKTLLLTCHIAHVHGHSVLRVIATYFHVVKGECRLKRSIIREHCGRCQRFSFMGLVLRSYELPCLLKVLPR